MKTNSPAAPAHVQRKKNYRRWHAWLGVLSALFMLLVSVTGILLEAPRSWRLGELTVPVKWVPGYQAIGADRILTQIKCALTDAAGQVFVGTRKGLFLIDGATARPVPELDGKDIFNLSLQGERLLVGSRESAWLREADGRWHQVTHSRGAASFDAAGGVVVNRGINGLHVTHDRGQTWTRLDAVNAALRAGPYPDQVTVSQFVLDLHTGSALVGARFMPFYVYVLSAILIILALSGFLIRPSYLRRKRPASRPPQKSAHA